MNDIVFSVEDIHRLREEHYEVIKDMTPEEIIARTNRNASEALRIMAELIEDENSTTAPRPDPRVAE